MTLLIIAIYFFGVVLSYILLRSVVKRFQGVWKKSDRAKSLFFSFTLSWIMAIVLCIDLIVKGFDSEEPASW